MEEVEFEYRVEEDEKEIVEDVVERRFKVGDLVEFWEVPLFRGYRTDSGDPPCMGEGRFMVEESMG